VKSEGRAADENVLNEVNTNLYKQKNPLVNSECSPVDVFPVILYLCYRTAYISVLKNRIRIGAETPFKKVVSGSKKIIPDPQHCDMLFQKIYCPHRYPECAENTVYIHSYLWPLLGVLDILGRIRIRGSIPLTNGVGSWYFRQ
jgi:hypothetical protein